MYTSSPTTLIIAIDPSSMIQSIQGAMKRNCFAVLFAVLALSVLLAAPSASAQQVSVTTDDVVVGDETGQTFSVPIQVSNLDAVSDVNSYQFDLGFPTGKLTFEEFQVSNTLTGDAGFSVSQPDSADANASGTATFGGFSQGTPLGAVDSSGTLVRAVFTLSDTLDAAVTIQNVTFNGGDIAADLAEADFSVLVAQNTASIVEEQKGTGAETILKIQGSDYAGLDIKAFDLAIQFPDGITAPSSGAASVPQDGFSTSSDFNSQTGVLTVSSFSQSGDELAGDGVILEVTLNPVETPGTFDFAFQRDNSGFQDTNGDEVSVTLSGGSLTFQGPITIAEARDRGPDSRVTVDGTVTRAFGSYVRFQDESGPTGASGLVIRQTSGDLSSEFQQDISDGNITKGTQIQVTGTLSAFFGLLQINNQDLSNYAVQEQNAVPPAQAVELSTLSADGEDYESELVEVDSLQFVNPDTTDGTLNEDFTYTVEDPSGTTFQYRVQGPSETSVIGAPITQGMFTYTGVVGEFDGTPQLIPIRIETGLPVELANFEATRNGPSVQLTWTTASETNNAGFRVQHRAPGQSDWVQLGYVESKASGGTATEAKSYRYSVGEELAAGTHAFRLRQVDLDGSTTIAGKTTVEVRMDEALTLTAPSPNPTSGQATLAFGVKESSETEIVVYNVLGQQVKTLYEGTPRAEQTRRVSFDTSQLPSGTYFVQARSGGIQKTTRLTVIR
jgi:hypothetical protein